MGNELAKTGQTNAELMSKVEGFVGMLNKKPSDSDVRQNKFSNNTKYLPISHVQMTLDELFFGLWSTKNFKHSIVANEIVGAIELEVYHPVAGVWLTRTGAASSMIRQQKDADLTDVSKKIKNALEMDYPHLLADCIKSAAKSLGKAFGRDLNREFEDTYNAVLAGAQSMGVEIEPGQDPTSALLAKINEGLEQITDLEALAKYFNQNPDWKSNRDVIAAFTKRKSELQTAK